VNILNFSKKIIGFVIEILFPSHCLSCNKSNEIICDDCLLKIRLADRETRENIIAVFDYRDPVIKKAIWRLKYYHQKYFGERLGKILYEYTKDEVADLKFLSSGKAIMVVPVPISKRRQSFRGYNQSIILAKGFCKEDKENLELAVDLVYKKNETEAQAKIKDRASRLKNIRGSFEIFGNKNIKGRTIIIIDDVTTTGGTMLEIAKILKKSGAKKVVGYALAH